VHAMYAEMRVSSECLKCNAVENDVFDQVPFVKQKGGVVCDVVVLVTSGIQRDKELALFEMRLHDIVM
jgi:hypothetical protein